MSKTAAGKAAVFLDRDGTISHDRVEYISRPEDLQLIEEIERLITYPIESAMNVRAEDTIRKRP